MNKKQNIVFYKMISILLYCKIEKLISILFLIFIFLETVTYGQSDMFMSGNSRPYADAGRDINTLSKGSIFLDGSKSFVTDGSKIKYHWTFAPGLVLNSDNDFSSEIGFESYDEKYLESVQTYKEVLDVKLAENVPGTKLEVVLTIKDRIGFEAADTLIVEYYDPTIVATPDTLPDTLASEIDSLNLAFSDSDTVIIKIKGLDLLIQGILNDEVDQIDEEIINSIIMDQLKKIGFNSKIYLNRDLEQDGLDQDYNLDCQTDSCASGNARLLNAGYVLSWGFAESDDMLSMRVFDSSSFNDWIASDIISSPYKIIDDSGVYGLENKLRISVSKLMSSKTFKKEISTVDRLTIKNERWIAFGKYPIMLGAVYLLIDKVFLQNPEEPAPKEPPGFPHDGS